MGIISLANLKKTYYYLRKNGVKDAMLAAFERVFDAREQYVYKEINGQEYKRQRETTFHVRPKISVVVPLYHTPVQYYHEMIESLLAQSYTNWELVMADASTDEFLKVNPLNQIAKKYKDQRIIYTRLEDNLGISENTNKAIELASGDYIGLLDHDDILTKDALFEVAAKLEEHRLEGQQVLFLYSDEDKGDGNMMNFYDPNIKSKFDLDYLWSNNYICHFSVFEANLLKELKLRPEYDGAQDYDLILRTVRVVEERCLQVHNISKVLYHWRCHIESTAVNPQSKLYAYEAGKRALEDDLYERGIKAEVTHSKHLGFYQVTYTTNVFQQRPEVGMIAYPTYRYGKVVSGARDEVGVLLYGGLRKGFSGGYLHRASTWQQCPCADIDVDMVRPGLLEEFLLQDNCEQSDLQTIKGMIAFGKYLKQKGYIIIYHAEKERVW